MQMISVKKLALVSAFLLQLSVSAWAGDFMVLANSEDGNLYFAKNASRESAVEDVLKQCGGKKSCQVLYSTSKQCLAVSLVTERGDLYKTEESKADHALEFGSGSSLEKAIHNAYTRENIVLSACQDGYFQSDLDKLSGYNWDGHYGISKTFGVIDNQNYSSLPSDRN